MLRYLGVSIWLSVYFAMAFAHGQTAFFRHVNGADYYSLLEVDAGAGHAEIRSSFIKKIRVYRPDHPATAAAGRILIEAYEAVTKYRTAYDQWLGLRTPEDSPNVEILFLPPTFGKPSMEPRSEILAFGNYFEEEPAHGVCEALLQRKRGYTYLATPGGDGS